MADDRESKNEELLNEAAKLMGLLFIGRRDAKAVFRGGQWIALREKYKKSDFRNHLFGSDCLGAYLLDENSMVRCLAFDVDLMKVDAPYFVIRDIDEIERMEAEGMYDGTLDPDIRSGNLEAALHDPQHDGHRWAGSLVGSTTEMLRRYVDECLGLDSLTVVTGGGAHVMVPFGEMVPAKEARAMAHSVMEEVGFFSKRSDNFYTNATSESKASIEIEIFPKQDRLSESSSLGNLIRLPFGMHECGIRTYALDPQLPRFPHWTLPKSSSIQALRRVADRVGVSVS